MNIETAIADAMGRVRFAVDELEDLTEEYEQGDWDAGERAEWIEDLDYARRSVLMEQDRLTSLRQQAAQRPQ